MGFPGLRIVAIVLLIDLELSKNRQSYLPARTITQAASKPQNKENGTAERIVGQDPRAGGIIKASSIYSLSSCPAPQGRAICVPLKSGVIFADALSRVSSKR